MKSQANVWGIKITTDGQVSKDTTYDVTLYMVNGGTKVNLNTYTVTVEAGKDWGFVKLDGLTEGQQYQLVCGDKAPLFTPDYK